MRCRAADENGWDAAAAMMPEDTDRHGDAAPLAVGRLTSILLCLAIFASGYAFSIWLLDAYRAGDQEHYANFWQAMMWTHPSQWRRLQVEYLSSAEPLYRFIIGAGTYLKFDRLRYLAFWNGLLLSAIGFILLKYRASLVFSLLVFSNYYIFVLLAPAERLKFAYLMLVLAFCGGGIKWKGALSILSVFAHTQAIVQFVSSAMYYVIESRKAIFSSRWKTSLFAIGVPLVIGLAIYTLISSSGDVISQKADFYGEESQGIIEIIQWVLILICGMVVFEKRLQFFIGMLPMGVLTSLYGNRINVATLAFFCALSLSQRRTTHPLVLAVMAYMSFKTIGFITNVLNTGQGF